MTTNIANSDVYVHRMQKSLMDKMFFVDKVFEPIDTVVDFGCADGALIHALKYLFPEYSYIGYDISEEMIERAKNKVRDCKFCSDWSSISFSPDSSLLNVSSTIHEVYSYRTSKSVSEFWNRVFNSGFKYIAIRDMMLSGSISPISCSIDTEKVRKLYPDFVKDFENVWGSIDYKSNFIHFLLKYRYTENWDREVRENYLPITVESFLAKIPNNYEIVYKEHYILPYIKQQIKKDCNVTLNDATHFKILLVRKDKTEGV